jgi:putative hydrolase of the HAD superfamily
MAIDPDALPDLSHLPIDGVLFDVDDTLVDTRRAFGEAIGAVARVWLPELAEERHHEALARWRSDPNGHFRSYTRGELDFETQRRRRADDLQVAFGGEALDDTRYAAWLDVFWGTFTASFVAHADARPTIDLLRATGLSIGALTNAAAVPQGAKLAGTGLGDVPVLVGVDTLGFGKPDPRAFAEACRRLGTSPARTAYVGDELETDAVGAAAAGLVGVWLDRPGNRHDGLSTLEPDAVRATGVRVIGTLVELPGALGMEAVLAT